MRYENPWKNEPYFIDLGEYREYDLYALTSPQDHSALDFGARYSDEPPEYISGEAYRIKNEAKWELYVSNATAVAAARYFANYHGK